VVGEGVAVVPGPRISSSSSLAKSWEYGIVGVTISLGIGCSSRFWDPVASMGLSVSMVLLYGDKVWFGSGLVPCFLLPLGGFWLVLVTVLPGDSSANLSFGEGLLLLVREVVELVFLEAGLGAFFLSFSEDLAACVLAAFAGTVARLFELVCSFLFSTDVAVGELLILSKKTAASLASWDWRYSMHYFSSTIDV